MKNMKKHLTKILKDFRLIHTYIHTYGACAYQTILLYKEVEQLNYASPLREEVKISNIFIPSRGVLWQH